MARRFAQGGIDYIKDDHGLADQAYSPFAQRLEAVAAALRGIERAGGRARYVPSLSGELDGMRRQIAAAQAAGVDTVMIAPMIAGLANFWRLAGEPWHAFIAHPSMGGAARIAPPLLLGKLFRLIGTDAVVFPNHGGRFGYSPDMPAPAPRSRRATGSNLACRCRRAACRPAGCARCLISTAPT